MKKKSFTNFMGRLRVQERKDLAEMALIEAQNIVYEWYG